MLEDRSPLGHQDTHQAGRADWANRMVPSRAHEGSLQAGQVSQLLNRPHPNWSVQRANDVLFGREVDRLAVIELMGLPELSESWKGDLA